MTREYPATSCTAEPGVALAMAAGYDAIARLLDAAAGWAEDAIAGGDPPKWVIRQLITADRLIAAAARGEPVAL